MTFVLDKDFEGTTYEQLTEEEKKMLTDKLDRVLDDLAYRGFDEKMVILFVKKIFPEIYKRYNYRFCISFKK